MTLKIGELYLFFDPFTFENLPYSPYIETLGEWWDDTDRFQQIPPLT